MKVTNLVYTTRIGTKIDLQLVANSSLARYNPRRFNGLITKQGGGTCLLFNNGKLVIVGVKTRKEAVETMNLLIEMLRKLNFEVNDGYLYLRNLVAYHDYEVEVYLPALYNSLRGKYVVTYEPEISPALMIKIPYTIRIFHNGKVIFTGLKSFGQLDEAYEFARRVLLG